MRPETKTPDEIIRIHMGFSMAAGALPIPLLDIAAVTAIQSSMVKDLAKYYNIDFNAEKSKTLITALITSSIGSAIGRTGASILKIIPGIGSLLGLGSQIILSGASTYAVGKVFDKHFREDGDLSNFSVDSFRDFFEEMFRQGQSEAKKEKDREKEPGPAGEDTAIVLSREAVWENLSKLKDLKEQGIISEEDYNQAWESAFKDR